MKTWLTGIVVAAAAALSPAVPLFATVTILIIADFLFGLYRAWKREEVISSRKMSNTVSKIFLYNTAILVFFLVEKYVLDGSIPVAKLGAGAIAMVELKSLDENFQLIFGFSFYESMKARFQRKLDSDTKDFTQPCPEAMKAQKQD